MRAAARHATGPVPTGDAVPGRLSTAIRLASPAMNDSEHVLDWLQGWYAARCNDDWEHEWGVKIATLDNPGWTVTIDLEETDLEEHTCPRQDVNRSTHDWVWVWTSEKTFHGPVPRYGRKG